MPFGGGLSVEGSFVEEAALSLLALFLLEIADDLQIPLRSHPRLRAVRAINRYYLVRALWVLIIPRL